MTTKTLRAADLGYVWPESMPDGRTWVRMSVGQERLYERRPEMVAHWRLCSGGKSLTRG